MMYKSAKNIVESMLPGMFLTKKTFSSYGLPPAGHYSFVYTPSFAGSTWTTSFAFNTNSSSTHTFIIDNITMCPINAGPQVLSYNADMLMHTDYYPFGQQMPARTWQGTSEGYRYSHNSHEKEDAIYKGAQSAEYWMYDSRIGRRWERDPLAYEWQGPYTAFNNNPIHFADPLGLEPQNDKGKKGGTVTVRYKKGDDAHPIDKTGTTSKSDTKKSNDVTPKTKADKTVDKLDQKPLVTQLPTNTAEPELRAAPTGYGIENGQPKTDPSSPGGYIGNIEIIRSPGTLAELLSHHHFGIKPSVNFMGLEYNFVEENLSFEFRRHWFGKGLKPWQGGIAPSISLGTGGISYGPGNFGPYGVSTNGTDVNFFEVWGNSTFIKQFAVINKGPQNFTFYVDLKNTMTLAVQTSTTIYTFTEKAKFSYMVDSKNNLQVTSQTFFDLGGFGVKSSSPQINADTNYNKTRVVVPVGKIITIKAE